MKDHTFVGFGFGPIQSALFAAEAFKSQNFKRIVIAEIDQKLVDAVRANLGSYAVNVATSTSIEVQNINGIEIYNPAIDKDRAELIAALSRATEIVTSLPSVDFFDLGEHSVAILIAQGLQNSQAPATLIYTAENNNHAAEVLAQKVNTKPASPVQYLNTVIGKMSQVVTDTNEIQNKKLIPLAPTIDRAFLVEEFNKIFVTRCHIENFTPGINVFIEKEDLLPFEEAKLFGHNAIHVLLAFLGAVHGYTKMTELNNDKKIMQIARQAFLEESGAALISKYAALNDPLFTKTGYQAYADDLLERMTNPFLADTVERAMRDPLRKLGLHDRIFGTMALALEHGIEPHHMARGAIAGLQILVHEPDKYQIPPDCRCQHEEKLKDVVEKLLQWLWRDETSVSQNKLINLIRNLL